MRKIVWVMGVTVLAWVAGASRAAEEPGAEAPKVLTPLHHGIGRMLPEVSAKTISGEEFRLSEYASRHQATVIAMTSTTCPLCKKYLPTLAALEKEYASKKVGFVFINSLTIAKPAEMKAAIAAHKLAGPYLHDGTSQISADLEVNSTTQVIVIDAKRTVVYQGAVDDQYGLGYSLDQPKRTFLRLALDAFLTGKTIDIAATSAPGCVIEPSVKRTISDVTYHNRISRLINAHCIECHREGGVAPFALETREQLLAHKGMIKKVVEKGTMPPWTAAPPAHGSSLFINDRSLPAAAQADLLNWFKAGGPEGDKSEAPIARVFPKDWVIGKPDVVLKLPEPVKVAATGTMPYQKIVVDTNFTEDKWIEAVEIRPSNKSVVHHVLVFPLGPGKDIPRRAEAQGHVAAYVPGNTAQIYPEGYAKKLVKGGRLLFQMHYTPNGTAGEDQTEIAFRFAKKEPHTEVKVIGLVNSKILILPGDGNYKESAKITVPWDVTILAFAPHMHVRGKACRYEVTPKGNTEKKVLLDVPHYDFNWQLYYQLNEPMVIKAGSTIEFTAWYDNSDKNPANPNPKALVTWGPQTTDEMLIGYAEFFIGLPKDVTPMKPNLKAEPKPMNK